MGRTVDDRGVRGRDLGGEGERVRLDPEATVPRTNLELVSRAVVDPRDEELPDAGRAEAAHRVQPAVPGVELADDRDRARVRRPHRERGARDAADLADVRAEPRVQLLVPALHREVQVEVAERREKGVRVAHGERLPVRVLDLELVVERQLRLGQQRLPEPRRVLELRLDAARLHAHRLRLGTVRAHDDAAVGLVGAEDAVRIRA